MRLDETSGIRTFVKPDRHTVYRCGYVTFCMGALITACCYLVGRCVGGVGGSGRSAAAARATPSDRSNTDAI